MSNGVCREILYRQDSHGRAPRCAFHEDKRSRDACEGKYDFWAYFRISDTIEEDDKNEKSEKIINCFDMPVLLWAEDVLLVAVGTGLKLHTEIDQKANYCAVVSKVRCTNVHGSNVEMFDKLFEISSSS